VQDGQIRIIRGCELLSQVRLERDLKQLCELVDTKPNHTDLV
jgi:hypothetical protein